MLGKARSADVFLVLGPVKNLTTLGADIYHPNGQKWRDHWCAARETVCMFERDLFKCRKKTWKKCSQPFQPSSCSSAVTHPFP